jgi:hypothetical protein
VAANSRIFDSLYQEAVNPGRLPRRTGSKASMSTSGSRSSSTTDRLLAAAFSA